MRKLQKWPFRNIAPPGNSPLNIYKKLTIMNNNRRSFIKKTAVVSAGLGLAGRASAVFRSSEVEKGKRVGLIGLDTGHCVAFTRSLNDPLAGEKFGGYRVVAAVPEGTDNIEVWKNRIPEFTEEVKALGAEIVHSIPELLDRVDVVIITCIDGNKHLEQALPVLKAGKRVFIDKPFAAPLSDAYAIVEAAEKYQVPMFSASSLRYINGAEEINNGSIGKVLGVEAYSPAYLEEHHPDLFWYGVHGVEILYTLMGTGCKSVRRVYTEDCDMVVGVWEDDRIGTFRGIRKGKGGYGALVFGEEGNAYLDKYEGFDPLLVKVCEFFDTGIEPVSPRETLELFAFMQAADESKLAGGKAVSMESVMQS
jgi:predicted dehydrogenase